MLCTRGSVREQWRLSEEDKKRILLSETLATPEDKERALANSFTHYAGILATAMFKRNTLEILYEYPPHETTEELAAFNAWRQFEDTAYDEGLATQAASLPEKYQRMRPSEQRKLARDIKITSTEQYKQHHEEATERESEEIIEKPDQGKAISDWQLSHGPNAPMPAASAKMVALDADIGRDWEEDIEICAWDRLRAAAVCMCLTCPA